MKNWTINRVKELYRQKKIIGYRVINPVNNIPKNIPTGKTSKYAAEITEVDGIKFRSKKEANRYIVLKLLEHAGGISDLRLQVPYELNEGGKYSYKYIADFVYVENGVTVVEDTKGFLTQEYKRKRRLMKQIFGIEIKEV